MSRLTAWLLGLPGILVYASVGALVFAEDALFLGFVIPGETAAVLGGVAVSRGHATLPTMIVVVVASAVLGDTVGYAVGRHLGPRLMDSRLLCRHRERVERARRLLARRGGVAVLLGRFVAFLRALVPALAGAARMPYGTFLFFNALGALIWGTGTVLLGHLAGRSYDLLERTFGRFAALTVVGLVVIGLVGWRIRRHRSDHRIRQHRSDQRSDRPGRNGR
ncbi:DedA family protein [Micromonospora polyrhachis]|uniref:Membrane protein DedA with SNARE-associated domain n=1 Tax=Micromonospora polyrhachis TaxID=1282883 RepID=A0A7W7SW21_9ACTN|nr:DedA family protein [Micromonospora polyrhachis]MBB4962035.1 membrane protein DedA with SNARE-associated domain [Micromonospora polyrhachis]